MSADEPSSSAKVELRDHVLHRPCGMDTPSRAREWVARRLPELLALLGELPSAPRALVETCNW